MVNSGPSSSSKPRGRPLGNSEKELVASSQTKQSTAKPSCFSANNANMPEFTTVIKHLMTGFQENVTKYFSNFQESIHGHHAEDYLDYEDDLDVDKPPAKGLCMKKTILNHRFRRSK